MMQWSVATYDGGVCDECGKHRSTLYAAGVDPCDGVVESAVCFFCTKKLERDTVRR